MILLTADREWLYLRLASTINMTTVIDDDRVVPLHSFKHAATLQYQIPSNPHPLLIRVDTKSGHGAGKSTEKKSVFF